MQQKNESPSFFDPKTIIAIAAVAVVYFGWQSYMQKKYPGYGQKTATVATTEATPVSPKAGGATVEPETAKTAEVKQEVIKQNREEKLFSYNGEKLAFTLTSSGMGLKNVTINNYTDKDKNKIQLGISSQGSLFELSLNEITKPLEFNVTEQEPGHFIGTAQVGGMNIKRELVYDPKMNSFTNTVTVTHASEEILKGLSLSMPETVHVTQAKSFLMPSYEHQDFVVVHNGGSSNTVNFSGAKDNLNKDYPTATLLSAGSQYFAAAILDKSDILPEAKITSNVAEKTARGTLTYKPPQLKPEFTFSQVLYAGPKSLEQLKSIDAELPKIIDFGFFGTIARPLVYVMKAFHSVVGNWGLAIILLTLLVRLCVLPFNIMSIRSMKAMQKVQPKLQALREKYKSDPGTLNKETMALMKQNGANPLGGCLPMLIQVPVFFALYRVIGSSIELYQSPFFGWITDLSSHDKFYVLPVLMGISMFFQQKITPSTMDPTQAKIMMFLPVVFSVFMLQLPSGLTLYMLVSTMFGVIQQYIIMKDRTREAKA